MGSIYLRLSLFLCVISVVALILYRLWRWHWIGKLVSAGVIATVTYLVVVAVWPTDSFYIEEFESRSGLSLPDTAIVLDKYASFPELHGDYWSKAVIRLTPQGFDSLAAKLADDVTECSGNTLVSKPQGTENLSPVGCWTNHIATDKTLFLTLFNDGRTIYFEYWQI